MSDGRNHSHQLDSTPQYVQTYRQYSCLIRTTDIVLHAAYIFKRSDGESLPAITSHEPLTARAEQGSYRQGSLRSSPHYFYSTTYRQYSCLTRGPLIMRCTLHSFSKAPTERVCLLSPVMHHSRPALNNAAIDRAVYEPTLFLQHHKERERRGVHLRPKTDTDRQARDKDLPKGFTNNNMFLAFGCDDR